MDRREILNTEGEDRKKDLHIHTDHSDGTLSPEKMVEWAAGKGIELMAITDHDGMGGVRAAEEKGKAMGICVIPGIEISSESDFSFSGHEGKNIPQGIGLHILGYYIDTEEKDLAEKCRLMDRWRRERNEKLISAIREYGIDLTYEDILEGKATNFVGKPDIARALMRKGYIQDVREAFADDGIFRREKIRGLKKKKLPSQEAIELIKGAGGIPVLAHPGLIRHIGQRETEGFRENFSLMIRGLAEEGIEGIEGIYEEHSDKEKAFFKNIAVEMGLIVTKGSDHHGPGGGHGDY